MDNCINKEWKTVPGFSSYKISEYGIIERIMASRTRKLGYRPKGSMNNKGYLIYKLIDDKNRKVMVPAHRLVCRTFHGPPPSPEYMVAHFDGDRCNNHKSNVRWATSKENHADAKRHGTRDPRGERNPRAILTSEKVVQLRKEYQESNISVSSMARREGISWTGLALALRGDNWPELPFACTLRKNGWGWEK